ARADLDVVRVEDAFVADVVLVLPREAHLRANAYLLRGLAGPRGGACDVLDRLPGPAVGVGLRDGTPDPVPQDLEVHRVDPDVVVAAALAVGRPRVGVELPGLRHLDVGAADDLLTHAGVRDLLGCRRRRGDEHA